MNEERFMIATNIDGCLFANYFAEVMDMETAKKKLEQVRKSDSNAKLVKVVIEKGGEEINADKESGNS